MPLSILSNIAREAPLGSLLIAFLLGVCRRPPPPAARAACSARWMDRQTETGEPHASGSCPAASRCRAVDEEKMMPSPERIKIKQAMLITGETERSLQAAASRGKIPGAAKLLKSWTFDEAKLGKWIASKELRAGRVARDKAQELALRQIARSIPKPAKRTSNRPNWDLEERFERARARKPPKPSKPR
jgi:hypothetical protein